MINKFFGEYRFLSNFWGCNVYYNNILFPSAEHAYQINKINNIKIQKILVQILDVADIKRIGGVLQLRKDWDDIKDKIMYDIVSSKFKDKRLSEMLLKTGEQELIEGNTWGDIYWGVCDGKGENKLGKILMKVRKEQNDIVKEEKL